MPGLIGIITLFAFTYLFWLYLKKRIFPKKQVPDTHTYYQEVVGEASYLANLKSIIGKQSGEISLTGLTAALTPEPENPYDNCAVRVDINGLQVGYLPAATAKKHVKAKKGTMFCPAVIYGGGKAKSNYGVWLHY